MRFITVERPHQTAGRAYAWRTVAEYLKSCINYGRANGGSSLPTRFPRTLAEAVEIEGEDMHALTVLFSPKEVARYIDDRAYCGQHNKAEHAVFEASKELGWGPKVIWWRRHQLVKKTPAPAGENHSA